MKYLLDVNALISWAHQGSPHSTPFHLWKRNIVADELATCAITELGFVRVSVLRFGHDLPAAVRALGVLKSEIGHYLDRLPPPVFPVWATTVAHTTDAYLCQLAAAHGCKLATFDHGIRDPAVLRL